MTIAPMNPPISAADCSLAKLSSMQFEKVNTSIVEDPSTRREESPSTVCRPDGVASSAFLTAPKTTAPLMPIIEGGAPTAARLGNGSVALLRRTDAGTMGAPRRAEEGFKPKVALQPGAIVKCSSKKRNKPSHVTHDTASTISSSAAAGCNNNHPATGGAGENTGRWTAEEHRLFLQGLDEHGKGWKKIAALIKSRTVVQIRTHAQKYFQKLAKARQNGEDVTDTTMDCRALSAEEHGSSSSVKYKKQLSGEFSLNGTTKRKSITSIVASATREQAIEQDHRQRDFMVPSQEAETIEMSYHIAPALMPFIPSTYVEQDALTESSIQQQSQGLLSPALLEESLYRFLTPLVTDNVLVTPSPSTNGEEDLSDAAVPAFPHSLAVDPIKVPVLPVISSGGEASPTGVSDVCISSFWKESTVPLWYSTGADVEELLDDADGLDWLADSGDLDETYGHILSTSKKGITSENNGISEVTAIEAPSGEINPATFLASLSAENGSMSLPSLFDHALNTHMDMQPLGSSSKRLKLSMSCFSSATEAMEAAAPSSGNLIVGDEQFTAFDGACFDEHAFVSALLESNVGDSSTLPTLS